MPTSVDKFEHLDAMLDRINPNGQVDFLINPQDLKQAIDDAYNFGELADYQWTALTSKLKRFNT